MNDIIEKAQQDKTIMILCTVLSFLAGMAVGLLISPVKKGIRLNGFNVSVASGNGCNNKAVNPKDTCKCDCDCACDEDDE